MKKLFCVLIIFILIFCSVSEVLAGDILFRLTHGDQDALVIGKITDHKRSKYTVEVIHVVSGELNKKTITIISDFKYRFLEIEPNIEDYCVLSLDKSIWSYKIKWGSYKVNSDNYKTLKFIKTGLSDGAKADLTAFEWYINSGGKEKDFYFEGTKVYLRQKNGESIIIYPVEDEKINSINIEDISNEERQIEQKTDYTYIIVIIVLVVNILIALKKDNGREK
ncbi:hypothetical protein [Anaeromicrobium sediminis]|uniref:Uncharacterized protein n=1 Tax=Anaeromicrobium sediminis TaxID=1478221 RepID=A0A267MLP3_9FIRM|nr:hypothetical protein [Anaeromicrobium sediminis]PAB60322.1 hypothetical protein CCE28_05350 [Anaeromicrobium sediminis]